MNKWIFDQRERERKVFENRFGTRKDQTAVFTVTKGDKCLQPIFNIERVSKTVIGLTGQPEVKWLAISLF